MPTWEYEKSRTGEADISAVFDSLGGEEHFQKGLAAYLRKEYQISIEEFQRSILINPENPLSCSNIGHAYYDMTEIERFLNIRRKPPKSTLIVLLPITGWRRRISI
jgi:tetratricopeptide (TPR) repeat protein